MRRRFATVLHSTLRARPFCTRMRTGRPPAARASEPEWSTDASVRSAHVVDDVEVVEGWRTVAESHHLLRELLRDRQVGVLHRIVVRIEEHDVEVAARVVTVFAHH